MTENEFYRSISNLVLEYDEDNKWWNFAGGGLWDKATWIEYIDAAWELYDNARNNHLQTVVLGDTKIRSDAGLLFNFGLVSTRNSSRNYEPQEQQDRPLVKAMNEKRIMVSRQPPGYAKYLNPFINRKKKAVAVMGKGSILSAFRWSPLLNDALVIGAAEAEMDLSLALNEEEQAKFRTVTATSPTPKPNAARVLAIPGQQYSFKPGLQAKQAWRDFFIEVPTMFLRGGKPRVFAREILGLSFFGYRPRFSMHQLSFTRDPGWEDPTFKVYLDGLRDSGMTGDDSGYIQPEKMWRAISKFLFEDENELPYPTSAVCFASPK
jgi:hypothetical protein